MTTSPSGFHRPTNPFTRPDPATIRNTALALMAQAARLQKQREEKDKADD